MRLLTVFMTFAIFKIFQTNKKHYIYLQVMTIIYKNTHASCLKMKMQARVYFFHGFSFMWLPQRLAFNA